MQREYVVPGGDRRHSPACLNHEVVIKCQPQSYTAPFLPLFTFCLSAILVSTGYQNVPIWGPNSVANMSIIVAEQVLKAKAVCWPGRETRNHEDMDQNYREREGEGKKAQNKVKGF